MRRWSSWSRSSRYDSSPVDSGVDSLVKITPAVYQPDPISSLPAEIFSIVIEAVGDRYQRSRALRALANASKTLYEYVQPRLWRRYYITDTGAQAHYPSLSEFEARRKYISDRCRVLTRQVALAACIQDLTISISSKSLQGFDSSRMAGLIVQTLMSVPSLNTLNLHVESENHQTAKVLTSMMKGSQFPFRLKVFTGDLLMEPGIFPFLARQSSIEQYNVTCGKASPHQRKATRITKAFPRTPATFLPNMRRYTGHTLYAETLMHQRAFELVKLFVYWRFLVPDIQAANEPQVTSVDRTRLGSATTLILVVGDLLPVRQVLPLFNLISRIYGISPATVRHLRLDGNITWAAILDFRLVEASSLAPFVELESLECVCKDSGSGTWDSHSHRGQTAVMSAHFIQQVAEACPSLNCVVMLIEEGYLGGMVFQRVLDGREEISFGLPGRDREDQPVSEEIRLPSGNSTWLVKTYR